MAGTVTLAGKDGGTVVWEPGRIAAHANSAFGNELGNVSRMPINFIRSTAILLIGRWFVAPARSEAVVHFQVAWIFARLSGHGCGFPARGTNPAPRR